MTKVNQSQTTGIHCLPDCILSHIAAYLTKGTHTDAALSFAQTCPPAREAVLDALSYRIDYTNAPNVNVFANLAMWTNIFANSTRDITVNLVSPRWLSCNDFGDLTQLPLHYLKFLSPKVCTAIIPYQPKWLRVLAAAPRLRKLHIRTSTFINHHLLFDALRTLSLNTLILSCAPKSSIGCIFNQYALFDPHDGIIQACPSLVELRIECRCGCAVWPMLCSRPIVTPCYLTIECHKGMPPEFIHLASLHQQNLMLMIDRRPPRGDKALTLSLSMFLTELWIPLAQKSFNCAADFSCLSVCSKLERVSIVIRAGAERLLAGVISNWAELRVLELQWDYDCDSSSMGRLLPQASPGSLIRVAESAPKLQSITMKEIKVPIREITAVMKVLGSRLTHIGISNENQAEDPLKRYEAILETATAWNPGLLEITCYNCHATKVAAQSAAQERLHALMMRLERAAPFLSEYPFKHMLNKPGFPCR